MAGAISAGAYTAGVLDFLTEALDEWYKAKARGEAVPPHDVSLDVLSGASAGGICAAILAVMLQEDFEHIRDTQPLAAQPTANRSYESWVNRIDIRDLLHTEDVQSPAPIASLLDSQIIDDLAARALTPPASPRVQRPWVSPTLTVYLSLTNLRGVPYSLNGAAPGSVEETTFFYGDRIRFETVHPGNPVPAPSAHPLDLTQPGSSGGWDLLQTAAMATGAFPLFLAPRVLNRATSEYTPPVWESVGSAQTGNPPPVSPTFPPQTPPVIETLNVDGGITNNDPFHYAQDHLAVLLGSPAPLTAQSADRAVIGIAPFPTQDRFDLNWQPAANRDLFSILGKLVSVLLSQSRFFGESLDQVMNGATFNRFVIAPSDDSQPVALQCAPLSGFGGFFDRKFRAHDYALGRRNCQKFLRDYFVLPLDNAVLQPALAALVPATRDEVIRNFRCPAPGTYAHDAQALREMGHALPQAQTASSDIWLPVIPLCADSVRNPIESVPRAVMSQPDLDEIVKLILLRFKAVVWRMIDGIPSRPLRWFLRLGQPFIRFLAKGPLRTALIRQLGDAGSTASPSPIPPASQ